MHRDFVFLVVIVLGVAAISTRKLVSAAAAQPTRPVVSEPAVLEKELRDADLAFAKQTAARRLEGWMDFFAGDASTIHDGKTITGKTALRALLRACFRQQGFHPELDAHQS